MPTIKEQTFQGVKWAAVEKFSVQLIQFVIGIVLARLLAPEDFGTIGMLGIFLALSQTFVDSGFSMALVRKLDRTEEDCSTMFYFNIVVAIVCYAVLFGIAPLVARFYDLPILTKLLRVQAVIVIINSFVGVHLAKLTIDINFRAMALRSLLASVLSGVVGIVLAYLGFGVWALVAQAIASSIINSVFITIYCKWIPTSGFSKSSFKSLFSFGGNMLGASLLTTIYNYLDSIVIGKCFSPTDFGYYSRGTSIARLPVESVNGVLSKVMFPVFARIQNEDDQLVSAYKKYLAMTSMVIFFGCCLMAALGKPLVLLLLTDKWADSIIYLQIFSFAIMFDHINNINLNLIKVKGRSDVILKLEIIKRVISLSILLLSIPFGVIGICVSKILYTQIAIVINTYYNGKTLGMGYWSQMKDYCTFLLFSILACLPAYALSFIEMPHWIAILSGVMISCLIYRLILRKNTYMNELLDFVLVKLRLKRC